MYVIYMSLGGVSPNVKSNLTCACVVRQGSISATFPPPLLLLLLLRPDPVPSRPVPCESSPSRPIPLRPALSCFVLFIEPMLNCIFLFLDANMYLIRGSHNCRNTVVMKTPKHTTRPYVFVVSIKPLPNCFLFVNASA